jgi:uncharacterized protein (TIGR02453 family)
MPAELHHTLDFLRDLRDNNDREWFTANRKRYEVARGAFEDFVAQVIERFDAVDDLGNLTPSEAIYRLNRDVRFSPDKSPYKTHMGALLGKEGRKSTGRIYYIQIMPDDQSLVAGGMYMVFPAQLDAIRRVIADDPQPLRDLLASDTFKKYFGTMNGEQLKTTPKGYSKDHPAIDLLRYKQFMADHPLTDAQVTAPDLIDHVLEVCTALRPFNTYLYDLVEGIPIPERM